MDQEAIRLRLLSEEQRVVEGWDFSYLENRWQCGELPWDYRAIIKEALNPDDRLLDMGTGGGEFLLSLEHPHALTTVTEAWEPNIALCQRVLAPKGIRVVAVANDSALALPTNWYDVVLNRHESYDIGEVYRVLKPGGLFITQQVGGLNDADLVIKLTGEYEPAYADHDLANALGEAKRAGFEIHRSGEAYVPINFFDLGALVFFARNLPWEFKGFSVERHFDHLMLINEELTETGKITGTEHRFMFVARKPLKSDEL